MSGEFIVTLGAINQIEAALNGPHLKGRSEPRVAMVGRSNVGKSTLINAILEDRLAQTSAEPGKTRNIHCYLWREGKKIVVDLPGYGYAKAGHDERSRWESFIAGYIELDTNLEVAIVLLDARHGPTDLDLDAIGFLRESGVNVRLVFTKFDSLKNQSMRASRKKEADAVLREIGFDPAGALWVSAKSRDAGLRRLMTELREGIQL